ncbi:MAG: class I SAM-dependent methyltransferase [bacterium]|nr:class I SAM-dependent methyltransferase [bacterium]
MLPAGDAEASGHVRPASYHESGTVEAWNERYATRGMVWGTEPNRFLADYATGLTPRRVLDLGCGQGRNAVWLATQGHRVTGIDLSPVAIEQARRLAADHAVEVIFEVASVVEDWTPPPDAFDLVVLSYLQLPSHDRRVAHAKATEALAPGGTVWLIAHHSDNITAGVGGPPYPEVLFNERALAGDFVDLDLLRNEKVFRDVEGEDGLVRIAHDILLVAVKPAEPDG